MPLAFSIDKGTDQLNNESVISGASVTFKLDNVKNSSNVVTELDKDHKGIFSNKKSSYIKP
jgi:hypothetical protein